MANLRGGNHEKQIKDARHRMGRLGQKKRENRDQNAHSNKVQNDRVAMMRDFSKYAKETLKDDSKLNQQMTSENVQSFLNDRLEGLRASTKETYARGFGAMVHSLKANNIEVPVERGIFDKFVQNAKSNDTSSVEISRAISQENFETIQSNLGDRHEMSGVVAQVQYEMGYRVSEAVEVVQNIQNHLNENGMINGVIGKGGREYIEKNISPELIDRIQNIEQEISKSTYQNDLHLEGIKSHDFRISYAQNQYQQNIEEGKSEQEAKENVSEQLNHSRADITQYYLNRA